MTIETTKDLLIELKRPFPVDRVHWRIGATNVDKEGKIKWGDTAQGQAMCYIDARDVMKRLDEIVPMEWQNRYSHASNGVFICEIGIRVFGEWFWRANGAGETAFEAEKGGMSDAFKRAAVMWGVGQYLYKIHSSWINISKKGGQWVLNNNPELPAWATPEGYDRIVNRRRPVNEKTEKEYQDLLDMDDPLLFYSFDLELTDIQKEEIYKSFPSGKKTEFKRKASDLRAEGRDVMLELATKLEYALEEDDSVLVSELLEGVEGELLLVVKNNLSGEGQSRLENMHA